MITFLYAYRNRDLKRIQNSLNSLKKQTNCNFKVIFVDYGSELSIANEVESLVANYPFVQYHYLSSMYQPWNKSKALNYAIKKTDSDFCFVADVDIIFHPEFTELLMLKVNYNTVVYFKVGYLSEDESLKSLSFKDYKVKFYSNEEATGMSLLPVNKLKEIKGYDEFFHFWGAEDTDIHNRLKNYECKIEFYGEKVLLLHQWHPNYRNREGKGLNKELQLTNVVELNQYHLRKNATNKIAKLNSVNLDYTMGKSDYEELFRIPCNIITNEADMIDHFLFVELYRANEEFISVKIIKNPFFGSFKFKIKKILGKKVPKFYTLKEINDKLLLHIISFYDHLPYIYKVSDDFESIEFKIKK